MICIRNLSIRRKLTLITMTVTSAALLIASMVFVVKDLMMAREELIEHGTISARIIAENSTAALSFKNAEDAVEVLSSLRADPSADAAWILTPDGKVFAKFMRDAQIEVPASVQLGVSGADLSSRSLMIRCPIVLEGRTIGTVLIQENLTELTEHYTDFAGAIAIVFGAALVASLVLVSRLQRVISGPILNLTETAKVVSSQKNYSVRATQENDDELGLLVECFNNMLEEIQQRDQQLQSHRDHLEEQVLARTEELTRVNAELTLARDRAEQSNRAKSAFLANMSHEIRTPMTAICGYADMMLEPDQNLSDRQDCLQVIRRNAAHLLELINDILDLSKIEADKMHCERIDVDLASLVCEVSSLIRPRAGERGLQFESIFEDPIPKTIKSDPLRLRQILINLLNNAVKFTASGKVSLKVSLKSLDGDAARICFSISDTGIGISREQLARLFDSFSQADESMTRRFGGTGLGLTISRKLAALLGGGITVTSTPGVGSTFTIEIDAGDLRNVEMLHGVSESMFGPVISSAEWTEIRLSGRILFAEDGLDNQRLIATHLRRAGAEVTLAPNGKVAIELLAAEHFDLVLMDMQMPVLDGYAATSKLRQRGFKRPVIALTAHAMAEDRAKCIQAGCTDYLTKPINREKLLSTVASYLRQVGPRPDYPADPISPEPASATRAEPPLSDGYRSVYSDDPDMRELIEGYIRRLPAEVAKLREMAHSGQIESLRRIAHQLKGSGGGYGFAKLTELAAIADKSIKEGAQIDRVQREVDALISYIRGIHGYNVRLEALNAPTCSDH